MGNLPYLITSVFLGWSLGANDAANVFGTAVASRMVRYTTAIILTSIFVIIGSVLEGAKGIETLSGLTSQNILSASISAGAAALSVALMTYLKLPVSTSQAAVGAIIGIGLFKHSHIDFSALTKVVICWVGTPIGAMIISIILYTVLSKVINSLNLNIFQIDSILRWGLIISGSYGAFALGANNVANVVGAFGKLIDPHILALIGGASIAFGVLTYSKNVMYTVGKKLVPLDAFSAFIAILSEAITVHFYAWVGVPVSTSQAIIGGVLGIGIIKGMRTINVRTLINIVIGWVSTPLIACIVAYLIMAIV